MRIGTKLNTMEKKEIVKKLKLIKQLMRCVNLEKERIKDYIIIKNGLLEHVGKSSREYSSPVEQAILNLEKSQEKLATFVAEALNMYSKISNAVSLLNPIERIIIEEFYLNNKTIKQIMHDLNYSRSQIFRIKEKAIIKLTKKLKDNYKEEN